MPVLQSMGYSLVIIGPALPFIIADISYGARGRWLSPVWAGFQSGVGVLEIATGASLVAKGESPGTGFGVCALVLGGWFVTHGILSFVYHRPLTTKPGGSTKTFTPMLSVAPTGGGGLAFVRMVY